MAKPVERVEVLNCGKVAVFKRILPADKVFTNVDELLSILVIFKFVVVISGTFDVAPPATHVVAPLPSLVNM